MADGDRGDAGSGFDPRQPLLTWLNTVQEISAAALGSVEQLTGIGQAQLRLLREGTAVMAELPLAAVEDALRELARLREALRAVQLQMALVDDHLALLQDGLQPLLNWVQAWRDLTRGAVGRP